MAQSEIQERVAKLNTQLRFGRKKPALLEAYKLRAYLQLNGLKTQEAQREIAALKERIEVLERIAYDKNSATAQERARISAEIDALREDKD